MRDVALGWAEESWSGIECGMLIWHRVREVDLDWNSAGCLISSSLRGAKRRGNLVDIDPSSRFDSG